MKWSDAEKYLIGEVAVNSQFDKLSDKVEWENNNKITLKHPVVVDMITRGEVVVSCQAEKRNGGAYISKCTIVIPKIGEDEAKMECKDEIESSYPIEWFDKYGVHERDKALEACIKYKTETIPNELKEYYEKYLINEIVGEE